MGIRRTRGAARCARAYGLAQSRPKQDGTQGTAQRTQGQDQKKKRVCVRNGTETCAFQKRNGERKKKCDCGRIFWLRWSMTWMTKSNRLFSFPSRKLRNRWTDAHFSFRDPPEGSARQRSDKMAREAEKRSQVNRSTCVGLGDGQDLRRAIVRYCE